MTSHHPGQTSNSKAIVPVENHQINDRTIVVPLLEVDEEGWLSLPFSLRFVGVGVVTRLSGSGKVLVTISPASPVIVILGLAVPTFHFY